MKYDFDKVIDRRNTNALKWNVNDDVIPMWVADMDFQCAPCIQEAIDNIASFGVFGYTDIPASFYEVFQTWWYKHHNFMIDRRWQIFSSGTIPAISSIIRKLTTPGEKILVQAPIYNIFYNCILNNGREVISSNLVYDTGKYEIDFNDLEQKLRDPQTTMMILCNPHNPIGKVWSKEELKKIGDLCNKYHVFVISDEVHCDLCDRNVSYTPFASINTNCQQLSITCLSASKAFNLAGLQATCIVVPNEVLRHKVWRGLNTDEVAEPNSFACEATIAALTHGEDWLSEVIQYITKNKEIAQNFIKEKIPQLRIVSSHASYLLWIECIGFNSFLDTFCEYLYEHHKLLISNGNVFSKEDTTFIRINIACRKEVLLEGLKRLKKGVEEFCELYLYVS